VLYHWRGIDERSGLGCGQGVDHEEVAAVRQTAGVGADERRA
jgi:hypothetical protein